MWLHPLDAGLALSDLSQQPSSPHKITRKLLEALKLQIERCEFVDIVGHHQYVKIQFRGPLQVEAIRVRADEAMSFCLAMNARFYSTKTYMLRCREIDEELTRVEHGLRSQPQVTLKNHKYMM